MYIATILTETSNGYIRDWVQYRGRDTCDIAFHELEDAKQYIIGILETHEGPTLKIVVLDTDTMELIVYKTKRGIALEQEY